MLKMTVLQLGVLLLVICLSTQVVSQNATTTTSTKGSVITTIKANITTATTNATKPTGAGVSLHAGLPSVLTPIIVAASLMQRYC